MLNAVLFDLDNTLVDRDKAFRDCVYAHFSEPAVRAQLFALDCGGRGNREALFDFWTSRAEAPMSQRILGRLIAERLRPNPCLLEALGTLSKSFKLGIITNGGSDIQRWKFQAAGLDRVIPPDRVIISAEVGTAKPDPAIFLLACRTLGEIPANCLFVGDDRENDYDGAKGAGMRARMVDGALGVEELNLLLRRELAA
jgi:putative hydrolase of the HAD superfamily